ncbi:unnamed protein product [Effrenium voratum]|nr:unnamed protein product [Effrenium voratum]
MATLTSNDEQVVCGGDATAEDLADVEEGNDYVVANKREFFHEIDEVREALKKVVAPELPSAACRELCERIGQIWGQYQEQPALLDPFLEEMVEPLMGAIASAVRQKPKAAEEALPNLHLLSSLLYLLTTVRGYKTVTRLFSHEAADLEPCLEAAERETALGLKETWSTLYCLSLWLGMVLLTPFDLASIDSAGGGALQRRVQQLALANLRATSRVRDAAAWLLAKFQVRPDVQKVALRSFLDWTKEAWVAEEAPTTLAFVRTGGLQGWNQTLKLAPRDAFAEGLWSQVLRLVLDGPAKGGASDFGSSNLRKLRVSVACRAALLALPVRLAPWRYERGQRSLLVNFAQSLGQVASAEPAGQNVGAVSTEEEEEEDAPEEAEEVVELLLCSLSDSDTVVRWAAAKGVGRITNRLSRDFADQVLESLLDRCFSFRETDKSWHGGCLALAELTRRGLLLPDRLSTVVPLVCQALHFEQVSGNHTVGQHVRDAACYVCWAFARAYAPEVLQPFVQDLAKALIQVAVFDREINCRRAAAAAVQENVGRQGTFPDGIDVVTIADYWTLSSRRHSYLEVAPEIAQLGKGGYRQSLMEHLVDRKLSHQDMQIRLLAAQGLARLAQAEEDMDFLNATVLPRLLARAAEDPKAPSGGGTGGAGSGTVQARHGAVEGAAALTEVLQDRVSAENQQALRNLVPALEKARAYRGRGGEVIRQAACRLLGRIARTSWAFKDATAVRYLQTVEECARHTTEQIQVAAAEALRELAAKRFSQEMIAKCVQNFLQGLRKPDETIAARRGFALCLGALPMAALTDQREEVLRALCQEALGTDLPGGKEQEDPNTRQYAVLALGTLCVDTELTDPEVALLLKALQGAMQDYATDRRGDVGSWVREVAMEVAVALLQQQKVGAPPRLGSSTDLLAQLLRQAVEKIDRLRERAFGLLRLLCFGRTRGIHLAYRRVLHKESYDASALAAEASAEPAAEPAEPASSSGAWPPAALEQLEAVLQVSKETASVSGVTEPSKEELQEDRRATAVFDALVPLLAVPEYRPAMLLGLVVSLGGLTEHTAREAKKALLLYLDTQQRRQEVSEALLRCFESGDKRLLAPLLNTWALLLAQDLVPAPLASELLQRARRAARCRDPQRLRCAVGAFVGLLRFPAVRRQSLEMLLEMLGFSFPTVRQHTAQALYIRLLEEEGDWQLSPPGEAPQAVSSAALAEVSELVSLTPWATDDLEALKEALTAVYSKLQLQLPEAGLSILAPQKKVQPERREAQYADLVRENHF